MTKDLTKELDKLLNEDSTIYKVKGILHYIHGEEKAGIATFIKEGEITKAWSTTEKRVGSRKEATFTEKVKEDPISKRVLIKQCHCFRRQNGHPVIPLGGPGYIKRMFKAAAKTMGWTKRGSEYYGASPFIDGGISIKPESFEVTEGSEVKVKPAFFEEATTQVVYEYIERTPFEITVSTMKNDFPKDMTLKLIGMLNGLAIGPKGPSNLEIENVIEVKE